MEEQIIKELQELRLELIRKNLIVPAPEVNINVPDVIAPELKTKDLEEAVERAIRESFAELKIPETKIPEIRTDNLVKTIDKAIREIKLSVQPTPVNFPSEMKVKGLDNDLRKLGKEITDNLPEYKLFSEVSDLKPVPIKIIGEHGEHITRFGGGGVSSPREIVLRYLDNGTYKEVSTTNKLPVEATFTTGDIQIGAVELKNATFDDRVAVINTAPTTEFGVVTRNIPSGTQVVSAASLPLPAGAATSAKQLPDNHQVTVSNQIDQPIEEGGTMVANKGTGWVDPQTDALTDTELRATPISVLPSPAGTGTLANGAETTVAGTAVEVLAAGARKGIIIQNVGAANVRIGTTGVTASTGTRLIPGGVFTVTGPETPTNSIQAIREESVSSIVLAQIIT